MTDAAPALVDSVRLAWPAEAGVISELQRRAWATQYPAATAEMMLSAMTLAEMTEAWHAAISRPPAAAYRVLVAVGESRVVGFASTLPGQDEDAEPGVSGEVDQFVIDPLAQRRGHGSRLLNACADTLRSDGFQQAVWWVNARDEPLRTFLTAAGWAPDGATREIGSEETGVRIPQLRLHTDLGVS